MMGNNLLYSGWDGMMNGAYGWGVWHYLGMSLIWLIWSVVGIMLIIWLWRQIKK
ncbi:MAG: hypothetical protein U1C57_00355 [Candidatus Doudnabacteria bacterium]|nr:hypothetical protein [bacterium]MDZ4243542.1 hypothetical protein [Candidatus Doudnabacteria bacterium]